MIQHTRALVVAVCALVLAACSVKATSATLTQTRGSWSATLQLDPDPPSVMQDTTLTLRLVDAAGQPLSGADVRLDLTMPGMEMPVNRPEVAGEEKGVYRAPAIFTMAGKWQLAAEVTYAKQTEIFTFLLTIR